MAKILLSGLITDIAGKVAGTVFQRTKGGWMVRRKVSPRNPQSFRQRRSRNSLTSITQNWPLLTPTERDTWIDPIGGIDPDIDFYSKINQLIFYAFQTRIDTYAGAPIVPVLQPVITQVEPGFFTITASGPFTTNPADTYVNIYATRQLTGGTQFINDTTYLYLTTKDPGTDFSVPLDIWPSYSEVFGDPRNGRVIGIALKAINIIDGSATEAGRTFDTVPV